MPRHTTETEIRFKNIVACLTLALTVLKELNDAFGPPFVQHISSTIETLIDVVQVRSFQDGHSSN
jgi:glutamate racemase